MHTTIFHIGGKMCLYYIHYIITYYICPPWCIVVYLIGAIFLIGTTSIIITIKVLQMTSYVGTLFGLKSSLLVV